MPLKIAEVNRYLGSKLKLERREDSRHTGYVLRVRGEIVPFGTVLRVSRGSGDVDRKNIKGVAECLGMRQRELETSEKCHIGRECVLILLCWHLLDLCRMRLDWGGNVYQEGVKKMIESVDFVLAQQDFTGVKRWSGDERKALTRIRDGVAAMQSKELFQKAVMPILRLIDLP